MNTPDLNLLPVFEALLRHGNVTRAAAQMGLTQSAMSSALGRMRRQLGDPLFVNTRGGMLPTPRALELAPSLTDALAMVRSALDRARQAGLELAVADFFVVPLTADNYRTLNFMSDGRPDSERVAFYVKTRLGNSADEANQAITRLEQFVRSVPAAGRAEMRTSGPLTLSIVAPDQYRGQILDMIATEARAIAARFGPDQRIEAQGLDRPVEWRRAGVTEVFMYIPHRLVFRPAGG